MNLSMMMFATICWTPMIDLPFFWTGSSSWSWRWERGAWFPRFNEFWGAVCNLIRELFLPGEFSFAHPNRNPKLCLFDAVVAYQYILIIPSVCCFWCYPTSEIHSFCWCGMIPSGNWILYYPHWLRDFMYICAPKICTLILEVAHMTHMTHINSFKEYILICFPTATRIMSENPSRRCVASGAAWIWGSKEGLRAYPNDVVGS